MRTHHRETANMILFLAACFLAVFCTCEKGVSAQTVDECIECHMDRNLTRTDTQGTVHSLYVDKNLFMQSVHGQSDYTCVDCHEGVTNDHPAGGLPEVNCVDCHEEVAAGHKKSAHGRLLDSGTADAPQCYDCHTTHAVLPPDNPASTVYRENLYKTCGTCHPEQSTPSLPERLKAFIQGRQNEIPQSGIILSALSLIPTRVKGHGKVNLATDFSTSRCADCHFETVKHGDPELEPAMCADCHTMDRSSVLFGKIHKANVMQSPLMLVLMLLLYAAGIVGLVLFFKGAVSKKNDSEQNPVEQQKG